MNDNNLQQHPELIPGDFRGINNPETIIRIFVDTAYVAASGGGAITGPTSKGIYVIDNRGSIGSPLEARIPVKTYVHREDYIGFYISAIDPTLTDPDLEETLTIEGFTILGGNLFGSAGYPVRRERDDNYWIAQAVNASPATTYEVHCKLLTQGLTPQTIYFSFNSIISTT
ncbi:hypothetical protein FFE93_012335 [Yersinia sp. KBS0713]|uniref:hypothetical protein n=1 Tax=Yersinia TaxID=629 RepID=UPI00110D4412|nr:MULTISPECIES: hypothetical protein [Yersinia]QDW33773.1 hypothetical protein FFE93_012335 [Yersinia sp. KBS0713]